MDFRNSLYNKEKQRINIGDLTTQKQRLLEIQEEIKNITPINTKEYLKSSTILKGIIKKIVYKLISWYIEPIVAGINTRTNIILDSVASLNENNILFIEKYQNDIENEKKKNKGNEFINYQKFENKYRGSEQEIKERLKRYLDYFKKDDKLLDLGCGRGELLELVQEKKIKAIGIDGYEPVIEECKKKGLNVACIDMFEYLETEEDNSFDVITCIQVIEHMLPQNIKKLMELAFLKLKKNGILILETQNPKSVFSLTQAFYVDPTHVRPVHPEMIKFFAEEIGFSIYKEEYPEYAWVTDGSIPPIKSDDESFKAFNQRIEYLNNFLYGSTDYDVVLKK